MFSLFKKLPFYEIIGGILFSLLLSTAGFAQQTATISLQGKWKFALDPADEGIQKKWYLGNFSDQYLGNILYDSKMKAGRNFIPSLTDEINLPNTTDLAGLGLPDQSPWINYLQRKHKYIGATWFQRIIEIPEQWRGYDTELFLERVKWKSDVWIDGDALTSTSHDGLVVSHRHLLKNLKPGKHLISIRVDNRMIHPIGDKGHNYTEQTESIWNGIIGKIALRRKAKVAIESIRFFPNIKNKQVVVKLQVNKDLNNQQEATLNLTIKNTQTDFVQHFNKVLTTSAGNKEYVFTIKPKEMKLWNEYKTNLYTASATLKSNGQADFSDTITLGYREVTHTTYKIQINGNDTYIRGNQEALGYPPTGHPPMDVETWRKIFKIYKDYGLNQVRFHSSCPPDAAFQAADELGIYVMVELVWMTSINAKSDLRPISATTGIPQGLGKGDRSIDKFVFAETKRLLDQYGNHPSFVFFAFGNELDNINKERVNQWIGELKTYDNRHLYAGTTARAVLANDDFQDSHVVAGRGAVVNQDDYNNQHNYDKAYQYTTVPVIAHELGQFPVFPLWSDTKKYESTPFRFINLEKAKKLAVENGTVSQDSIFRAVSGATQQMLYKSEIERQFRSNYSAGFNLLQMNDYTGQGEALVGWLDAFYNSKNITTPSKFRQFCNDLVILAEFPKRIYTNQDTFITEIKINNSNPSLSKIRLQAHVIADNGQKLLTKTFQSKKLPLAEPYSIGHFQFPLKTISKAGKYRLVTETSDGKYRNEWDFWVYPAVAANIDSRNILITRNLIEVKAALSNGQKVLLMTDRLGSSANKDYAGFKPVFWSTLFFPGRGAKTLGTLINQRHPLFSLFPTDYFANWQWKEIMENARGFELIGEGKNLQPIVQPVPDFHFNQKLATLIEANVGEGQLVICGYDLTSNLTNRPASKQLLTSIIHYMSSNQFAPQQNVSTQWLDQTFRDSDPKPIIVSSKFHPGLVVALPQDVRFNEINKSTFELQTGLTIIGKIQLKLSATNSEEPPRVTIKVDGRETVLQLPKNKTQTVNLQYYREDFDDQKLLLEFNGLDSVILEEISLFVDN